MFADIFKILIDFGLGFFTLALLLRFVFQAFRVDFYNPISQAIVAITEPVVRPLRVIVPNIGGLNFAALLAALVVQTLKISLLNVLAGTALALPMVAPILAYSSIQLLNLVLNIFLFSLFIQVILSWVAPFTTHPGAMLVRQLNEPLLAPIRRVLPATGGLDFSVMVALLVIYILQSVVIPRLLTGL